MKQRDVGERDEGVQTLEQLIASTRDVVTSHAAQFRGVAELAFLEFELALTTFHWWVWTLALFAVASIMTCTFLVAAVLIAVTHNALSPTLTLLVMGGVSAGITCALMLSLRFLYKRMAFRTLRKHLTQPQDEADATAKAPA